VASKEWEASLPKKGDKTRLLFKKPTKFAPPKNAGGNPPEKGETPPVLYRWPQGTVSARSPLEERRFPSKPLPETPDWGDPKNLLKKGHTRGKPGLKPTRRPKLRKFPKPQMSSHKRVPKP